MHALRGGRAARGRRRECQAVACASSPPAALYSGSQCAAPVAKSIGSPCDLSGSNVKNDVKSVVNTAWKALFRWAGPLPASEKWSFMNPEKSPGLAAVSATLKLLL